MLFNRMKKGILIGIGIIIIGIAVLSIIELEQPSSINTEPIDKLPSNELIDSEEAPKGKSIKINLNDGIGAGDR